MAPSKAENLYKDITSNWAKWSSLLALVPVLFGLSKSDVRKILKGDLSALDPRVEVVESRACPCGIPWPQKCSRCGRGHCLLAIRVSSLRTCPYCFSYLCRVVGVVFICLILINRPRQFSWNCSRQGRNLQSHRCSPKGDTSSATVAVLRVPPPQPPQP